MSIQMRSQADIDEQMDKASDAAESGSKWPGMSYEKGVNQALLLLWVCGLSDQAPMEDDE